jgi:hypothetical protein
MRLLHFQVRDEPPSRLVKMGSPLLVVALGIASIFWSWGQPSFASFLTRFFSGSFFKYLLEHFGVALIVAGIVGIGYELLSHEKRLNDQVKRLIAINDQIADKQLDAVLETLLPTRESENIHGQVREYTATLVRALGRQGPVDMRPKIVALKFTALLLRYARNAAQALSGEIGEDDEHRLTLPASSASLADEILSEQLRQLQAGDSYVVISDFSTWHDGQLPKFLEALRVVSKRRRVTIRRLFCRFGYDKRLTNEQVFRTLSEHWDIATSGRRGRKYQIGISFGDSPEHVGVFHYARDKQFVSFRPFGKGTLERISISRRNDCPDFDKHWQAAITSSLYPTMADVVAAIHDRDNDWWSFFEQAPDFDVDSALAGGAKSSTRQGPRQAPHRIVTPTNDSATEGK